MSVCLFRRLTGVPCLTCGTTRACAALLSGDVAGALRLQPLAVVGGALAGAAFGAYSGLLLLRRRVAIVRLDPAESRVSCAVTIALAALNWLYLVRCGA